MRIIIFFQFINNNLKSKIMNRRTKLMHIIYKERIQKRNAGITKSAIGAIITDLHSVTKSSQEGFVKLISYKLGKHYW